MKHNNHINSKLLIYVRQKKNLGHQGAADWAATGVPPAKLILKDDGIVSDGQDKELTDGEHYLFCY